MSKKYKITFNTILELLSKVDAIDKFARLQRHSRESKLKKLGIIYEYLDEFGIGIDIDKQTPEQMLAIKEVLSDNSLGEFIKILES